MHAPSSPQLVGFLMAAPTSARFGCAARRARACGVLSPPSAASRPPRGLTLPTNSKLGDRRCVFRCVGVIIDQRDRSRRGLPRLRGRLLDRGLPSLLGWHWLKRSGGGAATNTPRWWHVLAYKSSRCSETSLFGARKALRRAAAALAGGCGRYFVGFTRPEHDLHTCLFPAGARAPRLGLPTSPVCLQRPRFAHVCAQAGLRVPHTWSACTSHMPTLACHSPCWDPAGWPPGGSSTNIPHSQNVRKRARSMH
jgi:hypothetical protein